jgi:mannose-6-phosphate isomerase-like protein (cupin superfamily)
MAQQTIDLHVNPSDETIRLGPLAVRFLLTGENSSGSIAAFELVVPGAQRLAAAAHSHDHYEETIYGIDGVLTWTVDGTQIDVGPGQALCIPRSYSPVRQQRQPGREGTLRDHTGRDRSAVFPRVCRSDQRCGRRAAGPSEDGRDHDPLRPHAGSAAASGVGPSGVESKIQYREEDECSTS